MISNSQRFVVKDTNSSFEDTVSPEGLREEEFHEILSGGANFEDLSEDVDDK